MSNQLVFLEEMMTAKHSFVSLVPLLFLLPKLPMEGNIKNEKKFLSLYDDNRQTEFSEYNNLIKYEGIWIA